MNPRIANFEATQNSIDKPLDNVEALRLLRNSVAKRRSLAIGTIKAKDGKRCAIGCLVTDLGRPLTLTTELFNEVSAVNDAMPRQDPKKRWKRVLAWLNQKVKESN